MTTTTMTTAAAHELEAALIEAQDSAERWPRDEVCAAYFAGMKKAVGIVAGVTEAELLELLENARRRRGLR
jgi:hypothetical protein